MSGLDGVAVAGSGLLGMIIGWVAGLVAPTHCGKCEGTGLVWRKGELRDCPICWGGWR